LCVPHIRTFYSIQQTEATYHNILEEYSFLERVAIH
jgi:hypothetical protein